MKKRAFFAPQLCGDRIFAEAPPLLDMLRFFKLLVKSSQKNFKPTVESSAEKKIFQTEPKCCVSVKKTSLHISQGIRNHASVFWRYWLLELQKVQKEFLQQKFETCINRNIKKAYDRGTKI